MVYYNIDGVPLVCRICNKNCKHLGSHLRVHGLTAKEYKAEFELPYSMALISKEIHEKQSEQWHANAKKYSKNLQLTPEFQFHAGRDGKRRISQYERKRIVARIQSVNATRTHTKCEVCGGVYEHIESHLYNAHRLLKAK